MVLHTPDQELGGLGVQPHSAGEGSGDVGPDLGVRSTVTFADVMKECRKAEE
jgi:hypothetical protein